MPAPIKSQIPVRMIIQIPTCFPGIDQEQLRLRLRPPKSLPKHPQTHRTETIHHILHLEFSDQFQLRIFRPRTRWDRKPALDNIDEAGGAQVGGVPVVLRDGIAADFGGGESVCGPLHHARVWSGTAVIA